MNRRIYGVIVAFLCVFPISGYTDIVTLTASIDSEQANRGIGTASGGTGNAVMTLDTETNLFNWTVTWQNLEAPTTANHFHGPGAPGNNGPVQISFGQISGLTSPSIGMSTLSDSQVSDLLNNLWYINFHTPAFPGGELRGQILVDSVIVNPFVLQSDSWESLVIPGNPAGRTIEEFFGDYLEAEEFGSSWVVFTFDPETQLYELPTLNTSLPQGLAFWMIQQTGTDVTIGVPEDLQAGDAEPSIACVSAAGCFSIPLPSDPDSNSYALVGSPYDSPTPLSDVRLKTNIGVDNCTNGCDLDQASDEDFSNATVFVYDPQINDYRDAGTSALIEPWQGYWLQSRPLLDGKSPELILPSTQPAQAASVPR